VPVVATVTPDILAKAKTSALQMAAAAAAAAEEEVEVEAEAQAPVPPVTSYATANTASPPAPNAALPALEVTAG